MFLISMKNLWYLSTNKFIMHTIFQTIELFRYSTIIRNVIKSYLPVIIQVVVNRWATAIRFSHLIRGMIDRTLQHAQHQILRVRRRRIDAGHVGFVKWTAVCEDRGKLLTDIRMPSVDPFAATVKFFSHSLGPKRGQSVRRFFNLIGWWNCIKS